MFLYISLSQWLSMLLLACPAGAQSGRNLDRFNYRKTADNDYGPEDWDQVMCPDESSCLGWPDTWQMANGWDITENTCRWCPADGSGCGTHHQSPIDLQRNRAISGSEYENECIDVHWMQYHESSCSFEELRKYDSFVVDRHALRIIQPMSPGQNGTYRIDCQDAEGRRFGRIDFSKGYSQWWHLSHIDFHVPSEHTQEGKRYDGELHMYHFYSVSGQTAGVDNEMSSVTMFLEAYDDATELDFLNRIICAWREEEEKTREECGIDSITSEYPGCVRYQRGQTGGGSTTTQEFNRKLTEAPRKRPVSAHDIIIQNHHHMSFNSSYKPLTIEMDPYHDFKDVDFDWDAFIAEQYAQDEAKKHHSGRELLNFEHVPWFNYFAMLAVRTEYYYRYSGTQTVPPCYGNYIQNSRKQTNHWRVMKDPIRVSRRQINEMHRLLRERIAPLSDPVKPCQQDTAADVDSQGRVNVARPLQSTTKVHYKSFCECQDWVSKWNEDQEWCKIEDQFERYYKHPYNFETDGF